MVFPDVADNETGRVIGLLPSLPDELVLLKLTNGSASSSVMVMVCVVSEPTVAFTGLVNERIIVSFGSSSISLVIENEIDSD